MAVRERIRCAGVAGRTCGPVARRGSGATSAASRLRSSAPSAGAAATLRSATRGTTASAALKTTTTLKTAAAASATTAAASAASTALPVRRDGSKQDYRDHAADE